MTQPDYPNLYEVVMEQLIQHGPQAFRDVITAMMNQAMQIERSQFLGAVPHERSDNRRGHANGFKPKQVDTTLGTLNLSIPKTRNHGESGFYPHSLEQGRRSERALMLCVAQMYVSGVSTRRVEKVLDLFGIEKISSTQVPRATALLDDALSVWRDRGLGEIRYLVLDARYESDCSKLSQWLLDNVPEGLTVFNLPESHHRKMRTTNGIERPIQQEIKRRTRIVRVFPNDASLLRLVSAILVEIDDEWSNADKRYIVWNDNNDST